MKFTTNYDILNKVKDNDEIAWEQFYKFYAPLIRLHGRDCGLKEQYLEDLIQNVMITLSMQMPGFVYDPSRGRFRDYLRKIIRARANDTFAGRARGGRRRRSGGWWRSGPGRI